MRIKAMGAGASVTKARDAKQMSLGGSSLAPFIEGVSFLVCLIWELTGACSSCKQVFLTRPFCVAWIGPCQLFRSLIQTRPSAPAFAVAGPQGPGSG